MLFAIYRTFVMVIRYSYWLFVIHIRHSYVLIKKIFCVVTNNESNAI